jgi:hypothetical protein
VVEKSESQTDFWPVLFFNGKKIGEKEKWERGADCSGKIYKKKSSILE